MNQYTEDSTMHLTTTALGKQDKTGEVSFNGNHCTVTACGVDVWGTTDDAMFANFRLSGDFDMSVHIESMTMPNLYTKGGIMVRDTLDAGSRNVFFTAFGDNGPRRNNDGGCELQSRSVKDGESAAVYPDKTGGARPLFPAEYPYVWLRLTRKGDTFKAFFSTDGKCWLPYGAVTLPLSGTLYAGICVTSHDPEKSCICTFSEFGPVSNKE